MKSKKAKKDRKNPVTVWINWRHRRHTAHQGIPWWIWSRGNTLLQAAIAAGTVIIVLAVTLGLIVKLLPKETQEEIQAIGKSWMQERKAKKESKKQATNE